MSITHDHKGFHIHDTLLNILTANNVYTCKISSSLRDALRTAGDLQRTLNITRSRVSPKYPNR